jgi:D-sedoheptulose 7-phosphate isomerase
MFEPDIDALRVEWEEHAQVTAAGIELLPDIRRIASSLCETLQRGGKLVTFGNGGSAADAQHFAGELLGRFRATRRPLAALALSTDSSVMTCIANDFAYDDVFERQVVALARPEDFVVGISTSGTSTNVVRGLQAAAAVGATTCAWTGAEPGPAGAAADLVLAVPSRTTARIQEVHTLAMHVICVAVDAWAASLVDVG